MAYHHSSGKKELNRNSTKQVSCIKGLTPYYVIDTETGETLSPNQYEPLIINLTKFVKQQTELLIKTRQQDIIKMLNDDDCPSQPVGAMQKYGINVDINSFPKDIMQKYRINRLIMHKTFTEYKSYYENQDPQKQEPTFNYKINLGAVDTQMCQLSYDVEHQILTLQWKCWTRDITLFFVIPNYVTKYNILKFCLPTIQYNEETNIISYYFAVEECLDYRINHKETTKKRIIAGYDLGRVKPAVVTIMTDDGKVIAKRETSKRVQHLNTKRERILKEKKILINKINTYDALNCKPKKYDTYKTEIERLAVKAKKLGRELAFLLGADIARICTEHNVDIVTGEDLTWVNDAHGSSRWVHGVQQDCIAHAVRRVGVQHCTVSPKDTSKTCTKCGSKKTRMRSSSRVVECLDCGHSEDRDFLASENIAARKALRVFRERLKEVNAVRKSRNVVKSWCPGSIAVCREWIVVPREQVHLLINNTVFSWNSPSVLGANHNTINT